VLDNLRADFEEMSLVLHRHQDLPAPLSMATWSGSTRDRTALKFPWMLRSPIASNPATTEVCAESSSRLPRTPPKVTVQFVAQEIDAFDVDVTPSRRDQLEGSRWVSWPSSGEVAEARRFMLEATEGGTLRRGGQEIGGDGGHFVPGAAFEEATVALFEDAARCCCFKWKATTPRKFAWKHNALRHSYISYRVAQIQNVAEVLWKPGTRRKWFSTIIGTGPAEGRAAWFGITPETVAAFKAEQERAVKQKTEDRVRGQRPAERARCRSRRT